METADTIDRWKGIETCAEVHLAARVNTYSWVKGARVGRVCQTIKFQPQDKC